MMKYRNREYNERRNEVLRNAGLALLVFGAAALGHVLVSINSAAVAVLVLAVVLGALGISALKTIHAEA
ncbi:MAG: hypothetical protein IJB73_02615 [Firmicutes bacterium]|nr:hypothetical protein [Bacillota bacterium]